MSHFRFVLVSIPSSNVHIGFLVTAYESNLARIVALNPVLAIDGVVVLARFLPACHGDNQRLVTD
jgi:hypothetical protein